MSVFKRKNSKFWWMKFTFDNRLIQQSTKCTSKTKAREVESAYRHELVLGRIGIKPRKKAPAFADAVTDFLEWYKINHAQKPNSYRRIEFSAQTSLRFFGQKRTDSINVQDIEKFILWRSQQISKKTGEEISRDTINLELVVIKTLFKRLLKAGVLDKSPAEFVHLLAKNKRKFHVLTDDEERRYIMACRQPLQDMAVLMLQTGMRPSEIYFLKRENVFIEKGFLQVVDGKTESSNRKIWLSEKSQNVLLSRLAKFKGDYLFPRRDKDFNPPTYPLNDLHRNAIKLIKSKFRIYDLRHSFATRMLESGNVDLLTLASMLGHSSLDQVIRYAHPSEQRKAEAIGAIEKKAKAV